MKPDAQYKTTVLFLEHPFTGLTGSFLDIELDLPFSIKNYCDALVNKVLTIGLSEFSLFLDYQCNQVKNPVQWLNQLEKLIKINIERFDTKQLQHRHVKLISQIDLKRFKLNDLPAFPDANTKKVNEFTDDKCYSFCHTIAELKKYQTVEEKIHYLQDQIFDYRQHPPEFISRSQLAFDEQCELEIKRMKKQSEFNRKLNERSRNETAAKLIINGDLKSFCDVFYHLMNSTTSNGTRLVSCNINQMTEHICSNFCEADGSSISPNTVRTYLSTSKTDSRPKSDNEI